MTRVQVMGAFRAEAHQLAKVMLDVAPADWSRATMCPPWSVVELFGHVHSGVARLRGMLSAPLPATSGAHVSAADYYRPDHRFSPQANAERVGLAQHVAAGAPGGHALAAEFDTTWRAVAEMCEREPADRVVRTRHGDDMLLTEFLVTRVVELSIHGLDLATALGRRPWLTLPATRLVSALLRGDRDGGGTGDLGWDELTFLRKATGRQPLTDVEADLVRQRGIRWLCLG